MSKLKSGPATYTGELQARLESIKSDLAVLHREMYWLAYEPQQHIDELNFDQIMDLKLAVDNMRELLWKYVDAAAKAEPERVQHAMEAHRVRRVSQLLQLLRERLGHYSEPQQPISFIEKVTAAIKDKLAGGGKAA